MARRFMHHASRLEDQIRLMSPLDEAAVRREVHRLHERGAEALVIHFIHAYANPAHEQLTGVLLRYQFDAYYGSWADPGTTLNLVLPTSGT
jgi:N-methylhydantoinase A/oxoprolinase/acetone carboxylase beta subunit